MRSIDGTLIPRARVAVRNLTDESNAAWITHDVRSTPFGDYFRLLAPGRYEIVVDAAGFLPDSAHVVVAPQSAALRHAQVLNFTLVPEELLQV